MKFESLQDFVFCFSFLKIWVYTFPTSENNTLYFFVITAAQKVSEDDQHYSVIYVVSNELASCDLINVSNKIANNIKVVLRPPLKPPVYTFKGRARAKKMTFFEFAQ